jgi:glucose/arabinose dehydrogenase
MHKFLLFFLLPVIFPCCKGNQSRPQTITVSSDTSATYKKYNLDKIRLPDGFRISVYAEVPNARSMTLSPSGILYVGNRDENNVYAVVDENKDGKADKVYTVASELNTPNGVAFKNGSLYIATISSILKIADVEKNLANPPKPTMVYDKFPAKTHHGWKFIAFGPDGKLYVPVGAPCNVCKEDDPVFASITRMNEDGTGVEIFANGVRNSVGFSWHPVTKQLWFTENGRDMMGDDTPGDELNTAPVAGKHFGFPFCHQGNIPDPEFGKMEDCSRFTAPVQVLGAHVAALGMRFYTAGNFGEQYKDNILLAEHGSWNRREPVGYKISMVKLDSAGRSLGYSTFAEGWLQPGGKVLGRPVDLEQMPDGSILVSDDYSGVIYRIWRSK